MTGDAVPQAALGLQVVEEVAARLNWGDKPAGFPKAQPFLARDAQGQRNRLLVFLISEEAAPPRGGRGPTVQIVNAAIGLLLLLPRRNERGGSRARGQAEEWLDAARKRLLGADGPGNAAWRPPSISDPLTWVGGALEQPDDDAYWAWVDRYQAQWVLDSQNFNGG